MFIEGNTIHYKEHYKGGPLKDLSLNKIMIDAISLCDHLNKPFDPKNIKVFCSCDFYVIMKYEDETETKEEK